MPRLDVYSNSELLLQVKVKDVPVSIGRGSDCDISLNDSCVSRRHAEVRPVEGGWEVRSEGRNGTRLNTGQVVDAAPLAFGDRLYLGSYALVFQSDDAPVLKRGTQLSVVTETLPAFRG
jgi:pSer/pThr/pTyr-binding forkhead associated (FHA) protein